MPLRLSRQIHTVLFLARRSCVPVLPPLPPISAVRPPHYHRARAYHSKVLLPPTSAESCSRCISLRQYSGISFSSPFLSPSPSPSPSSPSPSTQGPSQAAESETEIPDPCPPVQGSTDPDRPQYDRPAYELTFTCKPCGHRSTHVISKQAYHYGTTLVRCPDCKDRHVISDHLKVGAAYLL